MLNGLLENFWRLFFLTIKIKPEDVKSLHAKIHVRLKFSIMLF